jgi:hypothetical protein
MSKYEVHEAAVRKAKQLIDSGDVDTSTEWSDAAPSTDDENDLIEQHGYDGYGEWHLALDTTASEDTKGRFAFPYGDFSKVSRAGLIHAKQRAAQYDHSSVEKAADDLLERIDARQ